MALQDDIVAARKATRAALETLTDLSAMHRDALLKSRPETGDFHDPIVQARADVLAGKVTIWTLQQQAPQQPQEQPQEQT
jgi:hypothetical protein